MTHQVVSSQELHRCPLPGRLLGLPNTKYISGWLTTLLVFVGIFALLFSDLIIYFQGTGESSCSAGYRGKSEKKTTSNSKFSHGDCDNDTI